MAAQNFKYVIFAILILAIMGVVWAIFYYRSFVLTNLIWIGLLVFAIYIFYKYDVILQLLDYERAVIYRFGKVHRVGGPGWALIWPIIETYDHVDLRVKTIDVEKQRVVTRDGVEVMVDAVVYLKVKKDNQSVVNSVIEVENYVQASQLFITSSLRDVIGSMDLGEVISNIEGINAKIKENLEQVSKSWGITIESIEIQSIDIPESVLNAMHEQKAAVQQKLARMERALGHKAEIDAVKEAASHLDDKSLSYYYIKAIENMANSKGSKVFFPSEFSKLAESFTGLINAGKDSNKGGKHPQKSEYYKKLLKNYVDGAVKKSKGKGKAPKKPKKKK